jgi:dihydrofolate reductase/thymidylate synthase
MFFSIIFASTQHWGIGNKNELPWRIPEDMKFFKTKTCETKDPKKHNAVIMGRKTWKSMGERPLRNRINIVVSRFPSYDSEGPFWAQSLDEALQVAKDLEVESVFVIGGAQLIREAYDHPCCKTIYWTKIKKDYECDVFVPMIPFQFHCVSVENAQNGQNEANDEIEFCVFVRENEEEKQYLDLVKEAIYKGSKRVDRTLVGTRSLFGRSMRFDLRNDQFPLLTTKRVFWRAVAEELFWFLSGSTDASVLQQKGIKIWNGNASREYLDSVGLTKNKENDLGPVYGFQWRHFGAEYVDCHTDYTGKGVDQIQRLIQTIKTNPNDRRMVLSAWNVVDLGKMALPPCHMMCQFYVEEGELSCQMYQRSCDLGLGVPFNVASYALLTRLMAHVCGLKAKELICVMGDVHVYESHVGALEQQLQREPYGFPKLLIKTEERDIDKLGWKDLELVGYYAHEKVDMIMAV